MKNTLWTIAGLLTGALIHLGVSAASLPTKEVVSTTFVATYADSYDRYLWDDRRRFYFSFSTQYKVNNKPIKMVDFWKKPLINRKFQAKFVREGRFLFVRSINLVQ